MKLRQARSMCAGSAKVFLRDVGAGLLEVSHNSLALVGLCVVGVALFAATRADLRTEVERHALDWLLLRHEAREPQSVVEPAEPDAVARATATDPKSLPRQQATLAHWIARRYKVAPEPVSRLVEEAWAVGQRHGLDPTLILAIMAVESSFNPFAQSPVGAQGLMQVLTRVHDDKYEAFGGVRAAFDPVSNLRVGVQVLRECIARAGSLEMGLRYYVGAANLADDGGYAAKVLAEQSFMKRVAQGVALAPNAPLVVVPTAPRPITTSTTSTVAPAPKNAASAPEPAVETAPERVALL
jgi:soluble lytic murein transglycosylase-like protein